MGRKPHFDPETVRHIREIGASGWFTDAEIAREFLVTRPAITQILNGVTYEMFDGPIRGHDYPSARRGRGYPHGVA